MKKIFPLLLLATAGLVANAQTPSVVNDKNAEARTVGSFHAVKIASGIDLYISQGNEDAVAVSANEIKYRDYIKTEVVNGVLKIYYDAGSNIHINWNNRSMKAYVTIKNIDALEASGGSDVYIQGALHASSLNMQASGGSDLYGELQVTTLSIDISGGSDAKLTGKTTTLSVEASGGSDFHGYDLNADNCTVDASGGSDMYITVSKELNIKASGGSDVSYKGSPVIKEMNVSGSSDVSKKS